MFCLFLIILAATLFYLFRKGKFSPPAWPVPNGPEVDARKILAERFARGDITSDEFLERASVLNWTPGNGDSAPNGKPTR